MNYEEAVRTAREFHDTYERLAPLFGYETRKDTKQFDPESPNGKLMIAVCSAVGTRIEREAVQAGIRAAVGTPEDEITKALEER